MEALAIPHLNQVRSFFNLGAETSHTQAITPLSELLDRQDSPLHRPDEAIGRENSSWKTLES